MNAEILESLIDTHLPAAARGDQAAYGRIVAACQRTVTSIALAIVRDVPASEDIAQEAFLTGWQNLRKLNNRASFLPWLRQITRNLARDHLRARRHLPVAGLDVEALLAAAADPRPCPAGHLGDAQEQAIAAAVIDSLPEESREVLLLYYREGNSSRQVASLLGLQDAAVRKRLSRARERVREELLHRLGEFSRATAPGVGFTAAVGALLAVGAPPAAAATAFGVGAMGAANGLAKIGLGAMGATAVGILGGLGGIWIGMRELLRDPFDDREKREIVAWAVFTSLITVVFATGLAWLTRIPGWIPHLALSLAFMLGMSWSCGTWLPRIVARRRADVARDPAADARYAIMRRNGRIASTVGLLLGTAGLVFGLWAGGRLG